MNAVPMPITPELPSFDPRARFHAERRLGIGGSDVAPILGLSPWRTALDVYLEKTGEAEPQHDSEAMLWGRVLEPVIRRQYAERTGRTVMTPEAITSERYPFMRANADGITDDGRVLEIKTARTADGWGESGSDEIPQAYLLQVQHYMLVTALPVADVAVLIGGSDLRIYEVPADRDIHEILIEAEARFWQRVEQREPPPVVTYDDAVHRYGHHPAAGAVLASDEAVASIDRLRAIKAEIEMLESEQALHKAVITKALADRGDTLIHAGRTLATWKLAKAPQRFDTKAFAAAHPDLHAQFLVTGEPSRRLLIK